MKKPLILSILSIAMLLTCCGGSSSGGSTPTPEPEPKPEPIPEDPDSYVDKLPEKTKDGAILHAFGWTFKQIESQLPYIANAGFKSVQTLPVQTPKSNGSAWWAYYQPLSFSIAESSPLGTKEDLRHLCEVAENDYNISIIVDVVFNHLANIGDSELEPDGTPKVYPGVASYEPYIYEHRNDAENPTFHHNKNATGSGAETQYYQFGALPDLNTAHPYVQQRALDFLKECIDVGVDGFRFDAAKHIETPDDPDYPSDFWTNTLGVAEQYYKEVNNGKELFAYGEVLGSPLCRGIEVYTKRMSVIEDSYGPSLVTAVAQKKADSAVDTKYGKQSVGASLLVPYVESHDTFTSTSSPTPAAWVTSAWAIMASRVDSRGLYFARTDSAFNIGQIYDYTFKSETVGAVNRFHNRFVGSTEYQSASGTCYVNERVSSDSKGAVIVNLGKKGEITVDLPHLGTAVYYDQLTGNSVTVRDGQATFTTDSSGIAVLTKTNNKAMPSYEVSQRDCAFVDELEITISVKNATKATYSINGGTATEFSKKTTVLLKKSMAVDEKVTLKVSVSNGQKTIEETFTYQTIQLIPGYFNLFGIEESIFTDYDVYLWAWDAYAGHYTQSLYHVEDGIMLVNTEGLVGFLVVAFEKGHVIPNVNEWDDACVKKSPDIKGSILEQGYYVLESF